MLHQVSKNVELCLIDRRKRKRLFYYFFTVFIVISFVSYMIGVGDLDNAKRNDGVFLPKTHNEPSWLIQNRDDDSEEGEIEIPEVVNVNLEPVRHIREDDKYQKEYMVLEFDKNSYIITLPNRTYILPTNCPPQFKPNADIYVLDTMRKCGPKTKEWVPEFELWSYTKLSECGGRFVGYNNEFVVIYDVMLDKTLSEGIPGGENPIDVIERVNDELEYYKFGKGFFKIPWCDSIPQWYFFRGENNHLSKWFKVIKPIEGAMKVSESRLDVTIAITRYKYYNLYQTMSDLYNAFLVLTYLGKDPKETRVLLIEGHPKSNLDEFWQIFKSVERLSSFPRVTHFKMMIWGILGSASLFQRFYEERIPLIQEFHNFVLNSFSVTNKRTYNCDLLTVTIISRLNYIVSSRNPTGRITRKIANEEELLVSLRNKFNRFDITLVHFEKYSITSQLDVIASTDILVGMHGAGLSHIMFLPNHSAVIELFPHEERWTGPFDKYRSITRWRKLKYVMWKNKDLQNEIDTDSTKIPPQVLNNLVSQMKDQICGEKSS